MRLHESEDASGEMEDVIKHPGSEDQWLGVGSCCPI